LPIDEAMLQVEEDNVRILLARARDALDRLAPDRSR
jgi:hypothetical protein